MTAQNRLLGHGDSARFNLLGGSFGDAGDVVLLNAGYGRHAAAIRKRESGKPYATYFIPGRSTLTRDRYHYTRPRYPILLP